MKSLLTLSFVFLFSLLAICQGSQNTKTDHPNVHKFIVKEVLQTTSYTYLQAEENGKLQWMAMPKMEASVGETYYYHGGMEMRDFESKELSRTFQSVLFLNGVVDPDIVEGGEASTTPKPQKKNAEDLVINEVIEAAPDGISLKELFSNKDKYANKVVKVRGKVMKFSSKIMNKNWIHLQDGSGDSELIDLTITTTEEANIGDIIIMEGTISLDKDFGAGYFYNIIMENAQLTE